VKPGRSSKRLIRRLADRLSGGDQVGSEPVRIDELISPLRYDVLARLQFFELLADLPTEARGDITTLAEIAARTSYFTWFHDVVIPRFRPELLGAEAEIGRAFAGRVQRSVELYESFVVTGYRGSDWPITLFSGRTILATDTGKRLDRRLYAGDGCHRLALLRSRGIETLEPGAYRVRVARQLTPLDHTARLIPLLGVGPGQYFAFLSLSYAPGRTCRTREQLLAQVRSTDPKRLPELEAVLDVDLPLLPGP
jgi:hypothetical protein